MGPMHPGSVPPVPQCPQVKCNGETNRRTGSSCLFNLKEMMTLKRGLDSLWDKELKDLKLAVSWQVRTQRTLSGARGKK